MGAPELAAALVIGFTAGMASGLVGIGGGILFVVALVIFLQESQLEAQATSLVAVLVVAVVGAYRQWGYGNLRLREGLLVGALSPVGVAAGTVVANAVPERALELSFAALQLVFAYRLIRRGLSSGPDTGA